MNEINKINLSQQTKFRLSEIIRIEFFFHEEINQTKLCGKKVRIFVAVFDYIDKVLTVLSASSSGVCIILYASVVGALDGTASASFTLISSLEIEITKKITTHNKKQEEKAW